MTSFQKWLDEIKSSKAKIEKEFYEKEKNYPKTLMDVSDSEEICFFANPHLYQFFGIRLNFKNKSFILINHEEYKDEPDYEGIFEYDEKTLTLHFLYQVDIFAMSWEETRDFKKDENYSGEMAPNTGRTKGLLKINKKQRFNYILIKEKIVHHPSIGDEIKITHLSLKIDKHISPPYICSEEDDDFEEENEDDMDISETPEFENPIYDPLYGNKSMIIQYYRTLYSHSFSIKDKLNRYKNAIKNIWLDSNWDEKKDKYYYTKSYPYYMKKIKEKITDFPINKIDLDFLRQLYENEELLFQIYYIIYRNLFFNINGSVPVPVYAKDDEIVLIGNKNIPYNIYDGKPFPNQIQILWIKKSGEATLITSTQPEIVSEQFNWKDDNDFTKWDKFFHYGKEDNRLYDTTKVIQFIDFLFDKIIM